MSIPFPSQARAGTLAIEDRSVPGPFPTSSLRRIGLCLIVSTLLVACGAGEPGPSTSDREQGSPSAHQPALASPSETETPDDRFESWLEAGGPDAVLYGLWVEGQLPGAGPPADATREERRASFQRWLQQNLALVRGFWDQMQDRSAQSDLLTAIAVALAYAVDHGSFAGFNPKAARAIEHSIRFNDGGTVVGEVSIRAASKSAVLLTTESASGTHFCAVKLMEGAGPESVSKGAVDAKSISDCVGGWPG